MVYYIRVRIFLEIMLLGIGGELETIHKWLDIDWYVFRKGLNRGL